MIESERLAKKESSQRVASQVFALLSALLALVMITVGSVYWDREFCRNEFSPCLFYRYINGIFCILEIIFLVVV